MAERFLQECLTHTQSSDSSLFHGIHMITSYQSSAIVATVYAMNRTLFDCGIKKSVELKDGRLYDITETLGKSVELSSKSLKCNICEKSFTGEQYLNIHVRLKHEIQSAAAAGNTHRSLSQGPSGVLQTEIRES